MAGEVGRVDREEGAMGRGVNFTDGMPWWRYCS